MRFQLWWCDWAGGVRGSDAPALSRDSWLPPRKSESRSLILFYGFNPQQRHLKSMAIEAAKTVLHAELEGIGRQLVDATVKQN